METFIVLLHRIPYPILFFIGLVIRLIIGNRRFKRRGVGGLQHFHNYYAGLIILFVEWVLKWLALTLMLYGLWGWLRR